MIKNIMKREPNYELALSKALEREEVLAKENKKLRILLSKACSYFSKCPKYMYEINALVKKIDKILKEK